MTTVKCIAEQRRRVILQQLDSQKTSLRKLTVKELQSIKQRLEKVVNAHNHSNSHHQRNYVHCGDRETVNGSGSDTERKPKRPKRLRLTLKKGVQIPSAGAIERDIARAFTESAAKVAQHKRTRKRGRPTAGTPRKVDFAKYRFGLSPPQIHQDMAYLLEEEQRLGVGHGGGDLCDFNDFNDFNDFGISEYRNLKNLSVSSISTPTGFLNDRQHLEDQLRSGGPVYQTRSRTNKLKRARDRKEDTFIVDTVDDTPPLPVVPEEQMGTGCDMRPRYCNRMRSDSVVSVSSEEDAENVLSVGKSKIKTGDRVRVRNNTFVNDENRVQHGVVQQFLKNHVQITMDGASTSINIHDRPCSSNTVRIQYREIMDGRISVFPSA